MKNPEFPHLPEGREPGGQSLRGRSERSLLWPFVGFVGTAMFAAGVWAAAGGRGDRFDRQEELFGGLFFAAMGLLCLFVALSMIEGGRPRRRPRLRGATLSVSAGTLRRGQGVSVTYTGRRPRRDRVDVGLACDERFDVETQVSVRGVRTTARQVGEATVYEAWQPVPQGAGEQTFTFDVPIDAPYSYEGDCVSYAWRVSAREARRLRSDARLDEPIWVDP